VPIVLKHGNLSLLETSGPVQGLLFFNSMSIWARQWTWCNRNRCWVQHEIGLLRVKTWWNRGIMQRNPILGTWRKGSYLRHFTCGGKNCGTHYTVVCVWVPDQC
jgi:hypothetical protein